MGMTQSSENMGIAKTEEGAICLTCGKEFTSFGSCRAHYKEQHCEKASSLTFPCHVCGKVFAVGRYRKDHVYRVHGISYGEQRLIYPQQQQPAAPPAVVVGSVAAEKIDPLNLEKYIQVVTSTNNDSQ